MNRSFLIALVFNWVVHGLVVGQMLVTEKSQVSFSIRNFGISVEGIFKEFDVDIAFDPKDPEASRIAATIDVASISTGIALRDKHLRKEDYFDAARFPEISFVSTRVVQAEGTSTYHVTGVLTIKENSHTIAFPFEHERQASFDRFKGSLRINRRDFGVGGNSLSMADEVAIELVVVTKINEQL